MSISLTQTQTWIYFLLTIIFLMSYSFLLLKLVGNFLEKPLLKGLKTLPICLINTTMFILFMLLDNSTTFMLYVTLLVVFPLEFYLLHKDRFLRVFFISLACILHVVIMRAIIVSLLALILNMNLFYVVNTMETSLISTFLTCVVLNIAIVAVLKYIPSKKMKILNQHNEQLSFMVACLSVIMFYFLINSLLYSVKITDPILNMMQITISIVMLAIAYIALLYSFKTTILLGYKEINSELKTEIYKEQQYRNSMMNNSLAVYEFNLSKNQMISGFGKIKKEYAIQDMNLSQIVDILKIKFVHPDDQKMFARCFDKKYLRSELEKEHNELTMEYRRKEGRRFIWVRNTMTMMINMEGDIEGYMYVKDIDALKKEEIELKFRAERDPLTKLNNKEKTEELISEYLSNDEQGKPCGTLFIIDIDNFKTVNDGLGHLYGDQVLLEISSELQKVFLYEDIVGRIGGDEFMAFMKGSHHKTDIEKKAETICSCFHRKYQGVEGNAYTISASIGIAVAPMHGETFAQLYRMADIAAYSSKNHGKNTYTIYEGEEFREYKANRREIDELIGSISFYQFKEEAGRRLMNTQEENLLFVRIDIHDFQLIKGLHGFNTEDEILRDIGKAIKETIQIGDIYARMANDNFVVLTSYTDESDIYSQGARFKENFKKLHFSIQRNYEVAFKIGFSRIEKDEKDIEGIIEMANQAHELAKKQNKAMYSYNETLRVNIERSNMIEESMEKALEENEFHVSLLPKYSLKTGRLVGGEACLCWLKNDEVIERSDVFMPIFVQTGFIKKIDLFQIKKACELIKEISIKKREGLLISLKQSSQSILTNNYVQSVIDIMKASKVNPEFIELEIAESTLYENLELAKRNIRELRAYGFQVAIDEFGNGSSSLTILDEVECDAIKIDNKILFLAIDSAEYNDLFRSILAQARLHQIQVVTERIETNQQIAMLLELNDAITQGCLYAQPLSMKEFLER